MPGDKKQQVERQVIPEKGDKKIDEARSKLLPQSSLNEILTHVLFRLAYPVDQGN